MKDRPRYPADHWLASSDPEAILAAGAKQQALGYSRTKNAFLFELLDDLSGKLVLDYGCGAGFFAVEAALRGAGRVVCVDRIGGATAAARLLARRRGVEDRMDFVAASSPCFGSAPRFDAVVLRDVVEHEPDDHGLLAELAGTLKPGGVFVLATQNAWPLNFLLEGGIRRLLLGQKNWMGWDETHLRFYTPLSLAGLLRDAGLEPQAWRGAYIIPHKAPTPWNPARPFRRIQALCALDHPLGRLFPANRLGFSLMVGARR